MHIAGNDFKRNGPVVKQWLDASFWAEFGRKMLLLRGETKDVFLVIWGDYQLWAPGFKDKQKTSAAQRYDSMCAEMIERAEQLNIPNRWLRFSDPGALELTNDNWHFARSYASELQRLLNDMLDPRFFCLTATYGAQQPPPPRHAPILPRP